MVYQLITDDIFDISNRLKQIDSKYFIVFNTKKKKYEVHYQRAKNTLELTIPFDALDARTVEFVRKTRIQNQQKILEEIERSNNLLEIKKQKQLKENIRRMYED